MDTPVDFHSHILPGIDDGSESVEQSIAMLQSLAAQGIDHVVATPHFYAHRETPEQFLQRRREAEDRLRTEMVKYSDLPRVSVGAEVMFFPGISGYEGLYQLTIDKTGYILIEMRVSPWADSMYRELEKIFYSSGLTPVIAHVDRYISPLRTHQIPERLGCMPVLVQANADFFLRMSTKAMAFRMLRRGQIHLLGSDCHNLKDRPPRIGQAWDSISRRLGQDALQHIRTHQEEIFPSADVQ